MPFPIEKVVSPLKKLAEEYALTIKCSCQPEKYPPTFSSGHDRHCAIHEAAKEKFFERYEK